MSILKRLRRAFSGRRPAPCSRWEYAMKEHRRMVAFLDKYGERCIDLACELRIAGVPVDDDRWTIPVSLADYREAVRVGFPMIDEVRFVVSENKARNEQKCRNRGSRSQRDHSANSKPKRTKYEKTTKHNAAGYRLRDAYPVNSVRLVDRRGRLEHDTPRLHNDPRGGNGNPQRGRSGC